MDIVMDMEDTVIMATMEREKLNQLLLLWPKLNQGIFTMATPTDMVMDMVDMVITATMAKEKLNQLLLLSQDIFIMATPTDMVMDMVDTVIMATMEREKLKLPLDIIMVTMDMEDT